MFFDSLVIEEYKKSVANRKDGENVYYQCGCVISPTWQIQMGESHIVTDEYRKAYETLTNNDAEDVMDCWEECGMYASDIFATYQNDDKYIVEEDGEGVYLLMRIDSEDELKKHINSFGKYT